ncbi:Sterile alpha motif domain-containing protein 3, partial [Oryzias melastigma]
MSNPAKLRIILRDHDIHKLDLPYGIPETVSELKSIVKKTFELNEDFNLHYKDVEFGEEYFSLISTTAIKDKDTIKVVYIIEPPTVSLTFTTLESSTVEASESSRNSTTFSPHVSNAFDEVNSTCSSESQAAIILSSPEQSSHRSQPWPKEFPIPQFAYDTEIVLASGNEAFQNDGIQLNFNRILPNILETLAENIFHYVAYPTSTQLADVAEALIQKHPCLKEPGSYNECYGWQQRLKYKMGNYRSKLRELGCPELVVNSLKKKRPLDSGPAKNIKKPRKAEVNYLPPHPQGETESSLEQERVELLTEVKKRNNSQVIKTKMAKTFSIRRQEIVNLEPPVSDVRDRWPALFSADQ